MKIDYPQIEELRTIPIDNTKLPLVPAAWYPFYGYDGGYNQALELEKQLEREQKATPEIPEIQKAMTQRLQEITDELKAAGFKKDEIVKAIETASRKVLREISKEYQKEKFAEIKSEDKI